MTEISISWCKKLSVFYIPEKQLGLEELLDELFKHQSEFKLVKGANLDEFRTNAIEYLAGKFEKADTDNDENLTGQELNTYYGAGFFNLDRNCPRNDAYILFALRLVSKFTNSFQYANAECLKSRNGINKGYEGDKFPPRKTNLGITPLLKSKNKIILPWPKAR